MFEQYAEFVAAQPRQRVSLAQKRPEQSGDLTQKLVPGRVPARVVDELELVEVEIEHRVVERLPLVIRQRHAEPALEFATIEQTRQRVVAREMRSRAAYSRSRLMS